jgi:BirA family biotin operon repressor/biotin-[acetyl-CoA-carboxylase] ligase
MNNSEKIIGNKILHYAEIDSTNDEAKRLIGKGLSEGTVIVADAQTKGRGKPGSSWFSPKGDGLYLSAIVCPYKNPQELASLTLVVAKAVVQAIADITGLTAEIKPPNDVLINGKKVCGILLERIAGGEIIIGIGVNVNNPVDSFREDISQCATSLCIETGRQHDINCLIDKILEELNVSYLAYLNKFC